MTQKSTNQNNPWTMDVRVRERNLKSGALTDKDVDKYLAALPDVEGQSESFSTPQPALAQPPQVHLPPQHAGGMDDLDDDDMDDEMDDSSDDVNGTAAVAPVAAHYAEPEPQYGHGHGHYEAQPEPLAHHHQPPAHEHDSAHAAPEPAAPVHQEHAVGGASSDDQIDAAFGEDDEAAAGEGDAVEPQPAADDEGEPQ